MMDLSEAISRIDYALEVSSYTTPSLPSVASLLPASVGLGKAYELACLAHFVSGLRRPGISFSLAGGDSLRFRLGGGPVSPEFTHIDVFSGDVLVGAIWNDVEFTTASGCQPLCSSSERPAPGHRHELDIVLLKDWVGGDHYPCHRNIQLGVECKETVFDKRLLKQALGVRLELGDVGVAGTRMLVFCNNTSITRYASAALPNAMVFEVVR
jgi:hypothetical protein